jgi:hypothetical protein
MKGNYRIGQPIRSFSTLGIEKININHYALNMETRQEVT